MEVALELYRQQAPLLELRQELEAAAIKLGHSSWVELEFQEVFVREILENDLSQEFPGDVFYRRRLLRVLLDDVETQCEVAADGVLAALLECGCSPGPDDNLACYQCYCLEGMAPLVLRVVPRGNEVGLRVWEAGLFLAEYCMSHPQLYAGKRCLELGAGPGITGLACAACCSPSSVTLTDSIPVVIANARLNAELNCERGLWDEATAVDAMALDWEDFQPADLAGYDMILGADVAYDMGANAHLVKVMISALERNPLASVHLASTIRNKATFNLLIEDLEKHPEVEFTDVTEEAQQTESRWFYKGRDTISLIVIRASREMEKGGGAGKERSQNKGNASSRARQRPGVVPEQKK
ncbi:unnamed protein product [Chrysoparadoxa australica]